MTILAQYGNMRDASIVEGMLRANGIRCQIIGNALDSIFPAPGAGTGPIDLYVDSSQLQEAQKLLDERAE